MYKLPLPGDLFLEGFHLPPNWDDLMETRNRAILDTVLAYGHESKLLWRPCELQNSWYVWMFTHPTVGGFEVLSHLSFATFVENDDF